MIYSKNHAASVPCMFHETRIVARISNNLGSNNLGSFVKIFQLCHSF